VFIVTFPVIVVVYVATGLVNKDGRIIRRTTRTQREFSVGEFIFTYVNKYFSGPLTEGGGNRPHVPYGFATAKMDDQCDKMDVNYFGYSNACFLLRER